ncbi:hypothetical protein DL93DRAFT_2084248 [Clavulina sp. PMI_390]|nr:hypothetical protein DL93DRAFT_2084248 [Clavulina sp. PMI_390]
MALEFQMQSGVGILVYACAISLNAPLHLRIHCKGTSKHRKDSRCTFGVMMECAPLS